MFRSPPRPLPRRSLRFRHCGCRRARPNIVISHADDLGWGKLGCKGFTKDIPTPYIDSLAKNGLRFTQGYVAATYCSPSRAGLMTGRYPTRFGHELNSVANATGLRLDQTTLATRLKNLGYATAAVGKWHLSSGPDYRPAKRGFFPAHRRRETKNLRRDALRHGRRGSRS